VPEVSYAVEVDECGIYATQIGAGFWTEQVLLRPIGNRIKWLAASPMGGLAQIPCADKEEAEFVRDYMTGHGVHRNHVKVKRVKAEAVAHG
jgi:hypothetical protein